MTVREYAELVKGATTFIGMYPLVIRLKVGDYYQLNKDLSMVRLGSIFNWPGMIKAVPTASDPIGGSETYYAGCERRRGATAAAGVNNPAGLEVDTKVALDFSREAGFVLAYSAGTHSYVQDVPALQEELKKLAVLGKWEPDWILVTEVIEATSATLAVSTQSNSAIELSASAKLPDLLVDVGISDPELGWTASNWKGSGYTSLCKPATPLFHCIKARKTLFGPKSELLGSGDADNSKLFVSDDPFTDE